jgi:hypothetical protein
MVAAMLVRETAIQMPIAQEALSASRGIIKMASLVAVMLGMGMLRGIIAITLLQARHRLHLVSNSSTTVWMVAEVGAAKSARGTVTPMPIALEV